MNSTDEPVSTEPSVQEQPDSVEPVAYDGSCYYPYSYDAYYSCYDDGSYWTVPELSQSTSEAMANCYCEKCDRSFYSENAVLQHFRDSRNHRGCAEQSEAASYLYVQDMYAQMNTVYEASPDSSLVAAPSDACTVSEVDSHESSPEPPITPSHSAAPTGSVAEPAFRHSTRRKPRHGVVGGKKTVAHVQAKPQQAPPRPSENYETAFPPLAGGAGSSSPSPPPKKWGAFASTRKLRADAPAWSPRTAGDTKCSSASVVSEEGTSNSSSTSSLLRAAAPTWVPGTPSKDSLGLGCEASEGALSSEQAAAEPQACT